MNIFSLITATITLGVCFGMMFGIVFISILESIVLKRSISKKSIIILLFVGFLFGLSTSYNILTI